MNASSQTLGEGRSANTTPQPNSTAPLEPWLRENFEPKLVSVVLATHNRASLLGETLESILRQTYDSIETVVVDDGSTDGTPAVLAEWQARFQRERGWRLECLRQENQGGPAGRNRAARHARGEYLNFFDDDDLLSHDKIATQVSVLRATGADIVYGPHYFFRHERGQYWIAPGLNLQPRPADEPVMTSWLQGWEWALQSSLVTRQFLQQIGPWDERLARGQDLDYKLRMLRRRPRMQHTTGGAAYIRRHVNSVSHRWEAAAVASVMAGNQLAEQIALEQLDRAQCREQFAQFWGRQALRFFEQGAPGTAADCLAKACQFDRDVRPPRLKRTERVIYRLAGLRGVGAWRRTKKSWAQTLRSCGLRIGASRPAAQLPLARDGG